MAWQAKLSQLFLQGGAHNFAKRTYRLARAAYLGEEQAATVP